MGQERVEPLYPLFVRTSLILALSLGFSLGALLLLERLFGSAMAFGAAGSWYPHVQVHGAAQIFGWIGLFIMGITLHIFPRFKAVPLVPRKLALTVYGLVLVGLSMRSLAQPFGPSIVRDAALYAGGLALLAGAAVFSGIIVSVVRRSRQPVGPVEKYVMAAAGWLVVGSIAQFAQMAYLVQTGASVIPDAYNEPILHLLLLGFAAQYTMGFSMQLLPVVLGIGRPPARPVNVAFWLINAGLMVRVAGALLGAFGVSPLLGTASHFGALVEAAGVATFALTMAPWRRRKFVQQITPGVPGYAKFIKTAFVWLTLAAAIEAGLSLRALAGVELTYFDASAERHALALGFLTLMIMGIAMRLIPDFGATQLVLPRWSGMAFWLVLASVSLRVAFTLGGGLAPQISAGLTGLSGLLGAAGLALWSTSIWRTLNKSRRPRGQCSRHQRPTNELPVTLPKTLSPQPAAPAARPQPLEPITLSMSPAEVVDRVPATMEVFRRYGFGMLADEQMRAMIGRKVTLGQAAQLVGVDAERLCAELNVAAGTAAEPSLH